MKPILMLLVLAALIVAGTYVLLRRAPIVPVKVGYRRRFMLAVALFTGLLGGVQAQEGQHTTTPVSATAQQQQVSEVLRAVWQTLETKSKPLSPDKIDAFIESLDQEYQKNVAQFTSRIDGLIKERRLPVRVGRVLKTVFQEMAQHRRERSVGGTCYDMTEAGSEMSYRRTAVEKQIEALRSAKKSGALDTETATKIQTALLRDLTALNRFDFRAFSQRRDRPTTKSKEIPPTDAEIQAAGLVVAMEGGQAIVATPGERLQKMKEQVGKLLLTGPKGSDWYDPNLKLNLIGILANLGLTKPTFVPCYEAGVQPLPIRSTELAQLQTRLLEAKVQAGILDEEIASRAAAAEKNGHLVEEALEEDIAVWQRSVRRAMRLLYQQGEVPSDFVAQVELAADIPILALDPDKALQADFRWYLQAHRVPEALIAVIEKAKLVPARRNHLGSSERETNTANTQFEGLFASKTEISLPEDEKAPTVYSYHLPDETRDLRLRMRLTLRQLVAAKVLSNANGFESLLGLPISGKLDR